MDSYTPKATQNLEIKYKEGDEIKVPNGLKYKLINGAWTLIALLLLTLLLPLAGDAQPGAPSGLIPGKYYAIVTPAGTGTGTVSGTGINCGGDCYEPFDPGTFVTLTATPDVGSTFTGWAGDCTGTGPCTLIMSTARNVTATFTQTSFTLTVVIAGAGTGTVATSSGQISCPGDCTESFPSGIFDTITATPTGSSVVSSLTGGNCASSPSCFVQFNSDMTVTATFDVGNVLTVTTAGIGSGTVTSNPTGITCGGDCTEAYTPGTLVTLTPTPNGSSTFLNWSGDCTGTGGCTVTMSAAKNVTANFNAVFLLTVTDVGTGTGTVTGLGINCGADCTEPYNGGDTAHLTATPLGSAVFSGWGGDCSGTVQPCNVTMNAAKNVTATFSAQQGATTGVETWCTNNPAICVCSKSFQGGAWASVPNGPAFKYQPGEPANAKSCGVNVGTTTPAITIGPIPTDVAAGIGNLRAMQVPPSTVMALEAAGFIVPFVGQRVGVRMYIQWASDYGSTSIQGIDGSPATADPCSNDKYAQFGDYLTAYVDHFGSSVQAFQAGFGGGISPSTLRNQWAMIEMYIHNFNNVPTTMEYHLTVLTGPLKGNHYTFSEGSRLTFQGGFTSGAHMAQNAFIMDRYRAGTCVGTWKGMFTVVGHWATNAGQRIPHADEVLPVLP